MFVATGCGRRGRQFRPVHSEVTKLGCLVSRSTYSRCAQNDCIALRRVYVRSPAWDHQELISVSSPVRILGVSEKKPPPAAMVFFEVPDVRVPDQKAGHIRWPPHRRIIALSPIIAFWPWLASIFVRLRRPDDNIAGAACTGWMSLPAAKYLSTPHDPVVGQIIVVIPVGGAKSPRISSRIAFAPPSRPYLQQCYRAEPAKDQISTKARLGWCHATRVESRCWPAYTAP